MNDLPRDHGSDSEEMPAHHAVVRAALADVPRAPDHHRDSAVAAALAAFDTESVSVVGTNVMPSLDAARERRVSRTRRWNLALGAAAAVVGLGVVGTSLLGQMSGSDEESSAVVTGVATEMADSKVAESEMAATGESATPSASEDLAPVAGGTAESSSSTGATEILVAPDSTLGGIIGPAFVTPSLSTPEELLDLPESLPADPAAPSVARDSFDCSLMAGDTVVGDIVYGGDPAVAVRTSAGSMIAFAPDCSVLAEIAP